MKQTTKYIGMYVALSLVMVAFAPNYIGEAEARDRQIKVVLPEPELDVDLTIKQVFEPQKSGDAPTGKVARGHSSESSDAVTYRVVYKITNSGETDVKNVIISVSSDTEAIDAKRSGELTPRHSMISVLIEAVNPLSITAEIVDFQV